MIVIEILFLILSLSFGIKIALKISQEESLLIAICGMGILTYILGLVNLLGISIYIIIGTSIISIIYTIVKLKKKEVKIKELLTLPTVVYVVTVVLIYFMIKNVGFIMYDEYMFWGTNLKEMIYHSCLWGSNKIDGIHTTYPPFTAIIEYIFCMINGEFSESISYFGIITLMLTTLMPLFKNEKYTIKSFLKIISVIGITYIAIIFFNYNIANLVVDCILGIIFAVTMFLIYKIKEKKDYITVIILLISLTLIKTNGILFAGIAIMQLFFIKIFELIDKKERKVKNILKEISIVRILLLTILTTYATWKIYYTLNGKQVDDRHDKNYVENINIKEFVNAITQNENASDRNKKIAKSFIRKILKENITIKDKCDTAIFIFIITNIMLLIYMMVSKNKSKIFANFISINIGFFLYMLTNLIIFMFVFQEYEGKMLMGFERYTQTYMLAMVLNIIYLIQEKTEYKRIIIMCVLMLLMPNGLQDIVNYSPQSVYTRHKEYIDNNIIIDKSKEVLDTASKDDKVYILDYLEGGFIVHRMRYYISPIKTNLLYEYNITSKEDDIKEYEYHRTIITERDFMEKLKAEKYNYVYIISANDKFLEEYQNILSEEVKKELYDNIEVEDGKKVINKSLMLKVDKENNMIRKLEE